MNKVQSKKILPLAAVLLSVILAITTLWSLSFFNGSAYAADDTTYKEFSPVALTIENNNFANASGNALKTPTSWTGAGVDGVGAGGTESGVLNLETFQQDKNDIKLDEDYPSDFSATPKLPENTDNTDSNILMINTRTSGKTAYGYSSTAITFEPGRFYKISAMVKTGEFTEGTGAAIRLTGLDESVAFNNINTYKLQDNNGWKTYTFFIASDSVTSKTVNLSLQVGDKYTSTTKPSTSTTDLASGYAFFDNILGYEIAPSTFYDVKASANINSNMLVKDFSDLSNYYSSDATDKYEDANWNFSKGLNDWSTIAGKSSDLKNLEYGIYNAKTVFDEDSDLAKQYNLKKDPSSSLGKFENDSKVLILSSFAGGKEYNSIAAGVKSGNISIERYKYYRISSWVKTVDVTGGTGATMVLNAKRGSESNSTNPDRDTSKDLNAKISNCVGDDANKARDGYKQYSFYVKGSSLKDYNVNLQLWLGSEGSEAKGTALYDNVTVESITPKQFTDNSSSGTIVNLDTDAGSDGAAAITFPTTGIANGEFYFAGDYTDYKFPLPASDWTKYDVSTVGTTGFSTDTDAINSDKIISGIMPTDKEHFNANRKNYGDNISNPRGEYNSQLGSVLLMTSSEKTAFCYRSPSFTVTTKAADATETTIGKLSVSMWVDNIDGYGANLVLKSGTNVISTIEKIQNTDGKSKTFDFYIEPGKTDIADLTVEIWLGLNDRTENTTKLSSGTIYVEKVAFAMVSESYSAQKSAYDTARQNNNSTINKAVYSFANETFDAFDYYDKGFVKHPYNFTSTVSGGESSNVIYGMFDPKNGLSSQSIIPTTFKNSDDAKNIGVLMLKNTAPAASKLTFNTKYSLEVDKYYKISVRLKVDIPSQLSSKAVGAGIALSGSEFAFKNITSTAQTSDQIVLNEVFQTYTFYIKAGAAASSVGIDITLGEAGSSYKYCSGIVYVNDISFTDITNTLFDENTTDKKLKDNAYSIKAVLSASAETPPADAPAKEPLHWMLIPSILFAVAILIAIVGFSVRKLLEKRKLNKHYDNVSAASYDRENTLNKDFNAKTANIDDKITSVTGDDQTYDKFNDDAPIAESKPIVIEPEAIIEVEPTEIKSESPTTPEKTTSTPKIDTFTDKFDD